MKYLLAVGIALLPTLAFAGEETCFYKSDEVSGLNKICYYSCASGEAAYTVKAAQLCPLTIKR